MHDISISPYILDKIRNGQAILFLGAGASLGSQSKDGVKPPTGVELKDNISDQFLGGALKDRTLAQVSELAKNESSLFEVQRFVADKFKDLEPANFHLKIPEFRWFAIVTTNYDLIVEQAYARSSVNKQGLRAIVRDGDHFSDVLSDPNAVPYLKLHGCVNQINDKSLPLILATEEYAKFKDNRKRLFRHFQDWALEHPIIFCGYDLSDPNIQQILFDIGDTAVNRPPFVWIKPSITKFDSRYWSTRRVYPVDAKFEDFLDYLSSAIPENQRVLASLISDRDPFKKWITKGDPSTQLSYYLEKELLHVTSELNSDAIAPSDFFAGLDNKWGAFSEGYDAERRITDEIILEAILEQYLDNSPRLYVVLGHAGSGKSVVLKRTAWEASVSHSRLVFHLRESGILREELFGEIWNITQEPFVIFIDDCLEYSEEIISLLAYFRKYHIPGVLVIGARTNEWNVVGERLDSAATKTYEVRDLSGRELDKLLEKLEEFNCLGALSEVPREQRHEHLKVSAERQILVALLEATHGKSFEEIVLNEYQNITPAEARILYLDVCTLHRFGVGVRAGLMSRVSGIRFTDFQSRLLKPLEHVVRTFMDPRTRDYAYRSRHQEIAKIVFEHAFDTSHKKADQVVRILSNMDIDYSSDEKAFRELIRGKKVADAFADRVSCELIYEAAIDSGADKSYILHQRAIFELNHPNGRLNESLSSIEQAEREAKHGTKTIRHTKANIFRTLANKSTNDLEKDKYREKAKNILKAQLKGRDSSYAYHSLANLLLDEVKDRTKNMNLESDLNSRVLEVAISDFEEILNKGLQEHPGDEYLLTIEAYFATDVGEHPRAISALEKAYASNPRSCYVAVSLSKIYMKKLEKQKARDILVKCLEENPHHKQAHLRLALTYLNDEEISNSDVIKKHLRRSFTDGDSNYDAQFWFARYHFLFGDRDIADRYFSDLNNRQLPPLYRNRKRGEVIDKNGEAVKYQGVVTNIRDDYCFVDVTNLGRHIFIYHGEFKDTDWDKVVVGSQIEFYLAFSLRGPSGVSANLM